MASADLFRFPLHKPKWLNNTTARQGGVYLAGALFSLALFVFIDAATFSKSALNGSDFHLTFVDWIPFLFSVTGMLIVNSIDKTSLAADDFAYSGGGATSLAFKARVVLFMGFAAMAGGLAGGVAVMVLKYVVPVERTTWPTLWMGVANLVANALASLSSVVLWISQNIKDDYIYHLQL